MTPRAAITSLARRADDNARGGFALFEVMLALMLIAVLAGLALPGLVRATGPSALRIAALQVAALLREDRNVALSSGRFTTTSVAGRMVRSGASTASIDMPVGAVVGMLDTMIPGVRFYPDGRSSGGMVVIASAHARAVVAISPDTGAINVGAP